MNNNLFVPSIPKALAGLSLSMLMSSLGTSIVNVALPSLAEAFSASFQHVQWVVIAYLLAITTLIVSVGRLGGLAGRRRLLFAGTLLFTAASLLCAISQSLWLLIFARAAQGLGAAFMMSLSMAFVGDMVPKGKTGSAMGLLGTMSALGTALGPSLGGLLIVWFNWRAIFLVNLPLGLLALFFTYRYLPKDLPTSKQRLASFDTPGTIVLAIALATYALAMTIGRGSFSYLNALLLLASALALVLFMRIELNSASPLLSFSILGDFKLRSSLARSTLVSTVMMTSLVVGPFYLSRALRLDAVTVGLLMSIGPLLAAFAGLPSGRLADKFGTTRLTLFGLLGMSVGCLGLMLTSITSGVPGYLAPVLILTVGYAIFQAANNTAVMIGLPPDQRGVISALLNLSRNFGLITGASLMGAVFALASGEPDITSAPPEAIAEGLRRTFAVAATLSLLAALIPARKYTSNLLHSQLFAKRLPQL